MCDKEQLVGYLYEELPPREQAAFEAHLAGCAECRQEVGALGDTRRHLASWAPPEPEFNFTVVRTNAPATVRKMPVRFVPRWALAAAAALVVIAGAAAIANVEIRYRKDGTLVVRTGWSRPTADTAVPGPPAVLATAASDQLKAQVIALQQRLQQVEQSSQHLRVAEGTREGRVRDAISELRKILAESEARHRTEMAVHIAQVWKDFTAARVNDWARMQQAVVQAQGLTHRQLQQQRESIDSLRYLHTVSQQK